MKTTIEMAHEAGLHLATDVNWMPIIGLEYAEKLIALARADERLGLYKDAYGQPEQEPTPEIKYKMIVIDDLHPQGIPVEQWVNPPQRTEHNFCSRCGKRTPDLITIHTCTPPQKNT